MGVHVPSRNVSGGESGTILVNPRYPRVPAGVATRARPADSRRFVSKALADPDALPYGDVCYCPGCQRLAAWDPRARRLRHLLDGTPSCPHVPQELSTSVRGNR